ncbi:sensor domain-containing diguanylate cyclase [Sporosarcina jeotgali]|uniref:Sensor domain-containing diguanylate cyclase n=1 Tax=Sporosarcina jeotgali TaxID=3020056 RepID=A0ABZ0L3I3_9BACL|nr:sensor domain-containing diguanylate cyclase [Sporosarcina sp. B2O-1]WOV85834.1 sensor domain-containing diguanylate cyclase [Sporosarcina sp. B2O-1]
MKISLKHLLLAIAWLSITLTLASSLYAGYRADQQTLEKTTLETNFAYAQKLAKTTEDFLLRTEKTLAYSANELSLSLSSADAAKLNHEAERLVVQADSLSSVIIADSRGIVRGTSSGIRELIGKPLTDDVGIETLTAGKPSISKPYQSQTGRLVVFISTPILDASNHVMGLIGGSIYLKEENILNDLLGQHFYEDGSYVYVVDEEGMLLYHLDRGRVGEYVTKNRVIAELRKGNSGSMRLLNSKNQDMLAGYASVPLTKWGVVSQRPTAIALASSKVMLKEMILKSLPFILLSALIILYFASKIAQPLEKLASYATHQLEREGHSTLESGAWYHEAIQLDLALTDSFSRFQDKVNHFIQESSTDSLTGLLNRRALNEQARVLVEQKVPFSLVILDIDRFKRVNDTYGHNMGDEVLKYLAGKLKHYTKDKGMCYRFGGEEFVILLPEIEFPEATELTNTIRINVFSEVSPIGEPITFSAGVANIPEHAEHFLRLLELADECLYYAKETGRNRVVNANDRNHHM